MSHSVWNKVAIRGADDCWPYIGHCNSFGYGLHQHNGKQIRAHRLALYEKSGPAPTDKPFALHSCDNPPCCNPAHLRWGSQADNNADKLSRGRHHHATATHCKRGHEFSSENTRTTKGKRECLTCERIRAEKYIQQAGGRRGRATGERCGSSKLTREEVVMIHGDNRPHRAIAADYGVSHTQIGAIKRGVWWPDVKAEIDLAKDRIAVKEYN